MDHTPPEHKLAPQPVAPGQLPRNVTNGQRKNLVMAEVVDEALRLRASAGDTAVNDYLMLNGVPATVVARVLSQSIRKRPAAPAGPAQHAAP